MLSTPQSASYYLVLRRSRARGELDLIIFWLLVHRSRMRLEFGGLPEAVENGSSEKGEDLRHAMP